MVSYKTGEYQLHLYVEEIRGLANPDDSDEVMDIILKMEVFSKTIFSQVRENVGNGTKYMGEHAFFEKTISNSIELDDERLIVSVMDHSTFGEDALVGSFEVALG